MSAPEQQQAHPLLDSIRVAVLAARANGATIRHLTLTKRDWTVCAPYMTPDRTPGVAHIGPLLVKYGGNAKASVLWTTREAGDHAPGNLVPHQLLPWGEE